MPTDDQTLASGLLQDMGRGSTVAESQLVPMVWRELRAIAASFLANERNDHTLQPTALVHEAYLRLFDRTQLQATDHERFLGVAARAMRRVLIDHARSRKAERRGGGQWERVNLEGVALTEEHQVLDVLTVHELLGRFAKVDARASEVVELRFFGGLTKAETAAVMSLSERTVDNDWFTARAWLSRELKRGSAS
jgi:RNA polymerase sigma-70 factor (ECF subfamily)